MILNNSFVLHEPTKNKIFNILVSMPINGMRVKVIQISVLKLCNGRRTEVMCIISRLYEISDG